MANPQCELLKPDGTRCGAFAVSRSKFCFNHDPASAEAKQAAVAKGGGTVKQAALPPLKLESYQDIQPAVERIISELRAGVITVSRANALLRLLRWEAELILGIPPKALL